MAYHSDVAIVMTEECFQSLKLDEFYKEIRDFLDTADQAMKQSGQRLYYWVWLEISNQENIGYLYLDSFLQTYPETHYYKIVLGEDVDDIDLAGDLTNNVFNLQLVKEIVFEK